MSAPASALEQALALLAAGRAAESLALAEASLSAARDTADLLNVAGAAAASLGACARAEAYWRRAVDAQPGHAQARYNLGLLLAQSGRHDEAAAALRAVLALRPADADALNSLGVVLQRAGQGAAAGAAFARALALRPGHAPTCNNLGLLLHESGRLDDAEAAFRAALARDPRLADTQFNLGRLLDQVGRDREAQAAFRQALALDPGHEPAASSLAALLRGARRDDEALAILRALLARAPGSATALDQLGQLMTQMGRYDEAQAAYEQALALRPDCAQTHNNLGVLLQERRQLDAALARFRRAQAGAPGDGRAAGAAFHVAGQLADWTRRGAEEAELRALVARGEAVAPFALLHLDADDAPELQLRNARLYAAACLPASRAAAGAARARARGRLRIGYLSGDFHEHATLQLLQGVLEAHDRGRFVVHAYSYGPIADAATQRAAACCDAFRDLRMCSDPEAAACIAADAVDILIDLKGFTAGGRPAIAALRPAPIVVSWLGYPGTLGDVRLADYLVGDPIVTPPAHAEHFSETIALLPDCYQPNSRRAAPGAAPSRAHAGLPEEGFVFCSFNQCVKIGPAVFDAWCRLLDAVPGSVLWLLAPPEAAAARLRSAAQMRGIDPRRLIFARARPLDEHLARLQLADLALDTYPYTSHTTGSDVLWAGVPLVARIGRSFASRVSSSLLCAAGLPELVTRSWEAYGALAARLAADAPQRAALRARLIQARACAPLFDTARFTRRFETLLEKLPQCHAQDPRRIVTLETATVEA